MKYLCMFVAFKIKTNKSEKGEIRKNLTTMKTGKTELPRSTSGADEFFILQGKKQGVRIEGEGYVIREFSYSDCESLAENADNNKIWNNLMDNFPHPYTKQDAFDYISMVKAMPGKPMRFAIEVEGKAVGSIGFGSEGDIERVTAEVGYWIGEKYWGHGIMYSVRIPLLCMYRKKRGIDRKLFCIMLQSRMVIWSIFIISVRCVSTGKFYIPFLSLT